MFIETYQVEEFDGRKIIHYNGYTCGLPCRAIEGSFCYIGIGESNYERACEEFENVQQYVTEMDDEELLDYEFSWKIHERLHMNDVTMDTPCGLYWFDMD